MGFLPELKINGKQFAQLTPMLVYLSQIGKMDKLNPMEEFKSGMMIQTATDVIVGSEGFQLTRKKISGYALAYQNQALNVQSESKLEATRWKPDKVGPAFGVVGGLKDQPRDKQCAAFHKKAIEGLKGLK